uniref:Uncharacterized protein n=1 Tax=Musa acuminata subsp. malaccensis TaxID=214687 RepID=A0A804HVB0_MUSAM
MWWSARCASTSWRKGRRCEPSRGAATASTWSA